MKDRFRALLPILVCAFALASAANAPHVGVILALIAIALVAIGPRWELDLGRQWVTSAAAAATGYVLVAALREPLASAPAPGELGEAWARFAAAMLLASAARALMMDPRGGGLATMALAFVSLMASGRTSAGSYTACVVLFLATSLWVLGNSEQPGRAGRIRPRRVAVASAVVLVAAGLALVTTHGVRRSHAWLTTRVRSTAYTWHPQVGFSDRMDLGALDELLDSDRIVLRVRGPRVDYLRGVSLDTYAGGRWDRSPDTERVTRAAYGGTLVSAQAVSIEAVSSRTHRFFLPLAARSLVTLPTQVSVDTFGSVRRETKEGLTAARFVRGARNGAPIAPPRPSDLHLPRSLRRPLQGLARAWTAGATSSGEKLDAIERKLLSDYRYTRSFDRAQGADPALDFLLRDKRGHCEYFATAFALVARAADIPTRIVMGYRVGERSPFGYYLVRDRNAHSWVEAWVPDQGWTTRDATPTEALAQNLEHESSYAASSLDALLVAYDDLTQWLESLSVRQTSLAWLGGVAVLVVLVARGARRRRDEREIVPEDAAPLPVLQRLLTTLARDGHERRPEEPIERLAARIPDDAGARLLQRYTALRYGSVGDAPELARDVDTHATARRTPP
ncbi:MAG TPA: transglutaminaseTgpA domain-containing protein [Polyangiaceae bacterium]|nr:transglutaminaseTgpA domain-containing protein [Polyangiaceae bacterium]